MEEFILALDQGTTSSRAIVFDKHSTTTASAQKEFTHFFQSHKFQPSPI